MPKKNVFTKTLVIVESPSKCKKIESFLGSGYKVIASFGHLREIASLKDIDVENGFCVTYSIVNDERKRKHVEWMRSEIAKVDEVILATDADREGEAIAWHICDLFSLSIRETKRIVFHEITESAILSAIHSPQKLNMPLVYSQQARQILDFLVGFTVSPVLWKHISNSLSAGRCQTPALQIIYDNDKEIRNHQGNTVFQTTGYFTSLCLPFSLITNFTEREEVHSFMEESTNFCHLLSVSLPKRIYYEQPKPLTTSLLQQKASNELHFSPKETMRLAQHLYEAGHITYMRTDSSDYCDEFLSSVKKWILCECNDTSFLSSSLFSIKKEKTSAHEAIRPTHIEYREIPDSETITAREKKLYKLIWETTVESCMSAAEYDSLTATISAPQKRYYEYKCEQIVFSGFKIIKKKGLNDSKEFAFLSREKREKVIECLSIRSEMTLQGKGQHYTEARLVHLLEQQGIGRPSTFSSLVEKIQERKYVVKKDIPGINVDCSVMEWRRNEMGNGMISESIIKREIGAEKGKLVIQPLGVLVCEFISQHFTSLFRYEYTNEMEAALDLVTSNKSDWQAICSSCYSILQKCLEEVKIGKKKADIVIDEEHTFLIGKNGPVIKRVDAKDASVSFLSVKPDITLQGTFSLSEIVDDKKDTKRDMGLYQGKSIIVQKGKYGWYTKWGDINVSLSILIGNRPIENISLEEVIAAIVSKTSTSNIVRKITDTIDIRKGEYGDYIFYKTERMKRPAFYKLDGFKGDYKRGHIDLIKGWIREKYQLSI